MGIVNPLGKNISQGYITSLVDNIIIEYDPGVVKVYKFSAKYWVIGTHYG